MHNAKDWDRLKEALRTHNVESINTICHNNDKTELNQMALEQDQQTVLHLAVKLRCNKKILTRLIEIGFPIECTDYCGNTPLHVAAKRGNVTMIKLMIEKGCPIQARNHGEYTALDYCIIYQHPKALQAIFGYIPSHLPLKENGLSDMLTVADKTLKKNSIHKSIKWNVFHIAAEYGNAEVASKLKDELANGPQLGLSLLEQKDKNGLLPIHIAIQSKKADMVALFRKASKSTEKVLDNKGNSCLHLAARSGCSKIFKMFIKSCYIFLTQENSRKETPLHLAVLSGNEKIVNEITTNNVNADAVDFAEKTPMHCACQCGFVEIVKTLIAETTCNLRARDRFGLTPLMTAFVNGHFEVLDVFKQVDDWEKLLKDVDYNGNTLLHVCMWDVKSIKCLKVYLDLKVVDDLNVRNDNFETPLLVACRVGNVEAIQVLVDYANETTMQEAFRVKEDISGQGPLHTAATYGQANVFNLLVDVHCLDMLCEDFRGENILHAAVRNNKPEMVRNILKRNKSLAIRPNKKAVNPLELAESSSQEVKHMFGSYCADYYKKRKHNKNKKSIYYLIKDNEDLAVEELDNLVSYKATVVEYNIEEFQFTEETSYKHNPLNAIAQAIGSKLLLHPITQIIVEDRWDMFGRLAYNMAVLYYLMFVLLISGFMATANQPIDLGKNSDSCVFLNKIHGLTWFYNDIVRYIDANCKHSELCPKTNNVSMENDFNISLTTAAPDCADNAITVKAMNLAQEIFQNFGGDILIIFAVINIFGEVCQIMFLNVNYFSFENLIDWGINVCVLLIATGKCTPSSCELSKIDESLTCKRVMWYTAAFTITLCWLNLLTVLSEATFISKMVRVFNASLRVTLHMVVVFAVVIVSFTFPFHMLLNKNHKFSTYYDALFELVFSTDAGLSRLTSSIDLNLANKEEYTILLTFCILFFLLVNLVILNCFIAVTVAETLKILNTPQEQATRRRIKKILRVETPIRKIAPDFVQKILFGKKVITKERG